MDTGQDLRAANIRFLEDEYPGLSITTQPDEKRPGRTLYYLWSPARQVSTVVSVPKDHDLSRRDGYHAPLVKFFKRHEAFVNRGMEPPTSTGNLSSLWR